MSSPANTTTILLLVTVLLLLAGGGAFMYMSQDDENTRANGVVVLPPDPNLRLYEDYPVVTDPVAANKDCSVEHAVYKNTTDGACYDSSGDPMTGTSTSCGIGTTTGILDTELSVGFVAAQGTGTCDLLQEGERMCEVPCPSDCTGGRWIEGTTCVRIDEDGEEVALFDGGRLSEGACGHGQVQDVRDPNTDDFKPAVGTGECVFKKSKPCYKTCTDDQGNEIDAQFVGGCGYTGIETLDRDIGSTVLGHEGCVKMDENDEPVKDEDGNYIEVGEGEEGRARWYQPVVYGDSTKCKNLVSWKKCQGPPTPTDCVGGWLDQQESVEGDQKWSACYPRPGTYVRGSKEDTPTYRYKQYHISQHASEALPGGGRGGAPCFAEVELEGGETERRQIDRDDDKVFEQQCQTEQWIPGCVKTPWVLDTSNDKGADTGYCVLDENGENPTKKYIRTVENEKGQCGDDDDPYDRDEHGNAEEKFEGCCYKTDWIDEGLLTNGNQPQTRTVKNCTTSSDRWDPDGVSSTRNLAKCHVEDEEWLIKKEKTDTSGNVLGCLPDGYKYFTRKVHNPHLCRRDGIDATAEMKEECCYQTEWETTDRCSPNGKYIKTRRVLDGPGNQSGKCSTEEKVEEEESDIDCCYKKLLADTVDGECGRDGWRDNKYETVGDCTGVNTNATRTACCYTPKDADGNDVWEPYTVVAGEECENGKIWMERSRYSKNCDADEVDTYQKKQHDCEPCARTRYTGSMTGFGNANVIPAAGSQTSYTTHRWREGLHLIDDKGNGNYWDNDGMMLHGNDPDNITSYIEECSQVCDKTSGCKGFTIQHWGRGGIFATLPNALWSCRMWDDNGHCPKGCAHNGTKEDACGTKLPMAKLVPYWRKRDYLEDCTPKVDTPATDVNDDQGNPIKWMVKSCH
jgi:hypothetical protein